MKKYLILTGLISLIFLWACTTEPELPPTPTATPPAEYEQIPGIYFGVFYGEFSSSLRLYEEIGKMPAIAANYSGWGAANPGLLRANANIGRVTLFTWEYFHANDAVMAEFAGRPLEAIVDGVHDPLIEAMAAAMRDFGKPVFLRWGHEMNGDWYPWGGANNGGAVTDGFGDPAVADGPERFVAAYLHIYEIFSAARAENVLWVWCPNAPFAVMEDSLGAWNAVENYYPGDGYVDWLCFDGYNWGSSSFGAQFNSRWTSFDEIFGASYQRLQEIAPGKPVMIGEFASTEDGGDKAAWVRDAFQRMAEDYPAIRAFIWFHISKETDWRIDSSPESLAAFQQALQGEVWLQEFPGIK